MTPDPWIVWGRRFDHIDKTSSDCGGKALAASQRIAGRRRGDTLLQGTPYCVRGGLEARALRRARARFQEAVGGKPTEVIADVLNSHRGGRAIDIGAPAGLAPPRWITEFQSAGANQFVELTQFKQLPFGEPDVDIDTEAIHGDEEDHYGT
jgi:hypothetical protein